jgi:two-component system nitrate/nitrite response regulator NarL
MTTTLSPREREIVAAVARGLSNRAIAAEAGIAPQTVKNHLSAIFQKLQVESRVQLAILALQRGLGEAPPASEKAFSPDLLADLRSKGI